MIQLTAPSIAPLNGARSTGFPLSTTSDFALALAQTAAIIVPGAMRPVSADTGNGLPPSDVSVDAGVGQPVEPLPLELVSGAVVVEAATGEAPPLLAGGLATPSTETPPAAAAFKHTPAKTNMPVADPKKSAAQRVAATATVRSHPGSDEVGQSDRDVDRPSADAPPLLSDGSRLSEPALIPAPIVIAPVVVLSPATPAASVPPPTPTDTAVIGPITAGKRLESPVPLTGAAPQPAEWPVSVAAKTYEASVGSPATTSAAPSPSDVGIASLPVTGRHTSTVELRSPQLVPAGTLSLEILRPRSSSTITAALRAVATTFTSEMISGQTITTAASPASIGTDERAVPPTQTAATAGVQVSAVALANNAAPLAVPSRGEAGSPSAALIPSPAWIAPTPDNRPVPTIETALGVPKPAAAPHNDAGEARLASTDAAIPGVGHLLPSTPPLTAEIAPAARMFAAAMFAVGRADEREEKGAGEALPAVSGPIGAAVAATAPTIAVAAPSNTPGGTLDLTRGDWMATMIDRIETLRDEGGAVRETRMKLAPDALGGVEIAVHRDEGGELHVRIAADNPQARAILNDAAPRLAEMAEARGLRLGGASVDAGGHSADPGRRDAPPAPTPLAPAPRRASAEAADAITNDSRIA